MDFLACGVTGWRVGSDYSSSAGTDHRTRPPLLLVGEVMKKSRKKTRKKIRIVFPEDAIANEAKPGAKAGNPLIDEFYQSQRKRRSNKLKKLLEKLME